MTSDRLGDRMKRYEHAYRMVLPRRLPVILRVDGRAFHTITRRLVKPFDFGFECTMGLVAIALCEEIQGAQMAYLQSDEISVLVHNYKTLETQPWFDNEVQKMASISAAVATEAFRKAAPSIVAPAHFDSRVFVLPEAEVVNYFIWRQQDAIRNSVQMYAHSMFSPRQCHRKNVDALKAMMLERYDFDWAAAPTSRRRGRCCVRVMRPTLEEDVQRHEWQIHNEPPVFSEDREYVARHLAVEED